MKENNKLTAELMMELIASDNVTAFVSENAGQLNVPSLPQHLAELCARKGIAPHILIRQTDIERVFGGQIFSGKRSLSRDNALKLALGLGLTVEETQRLLSISGNSQLYPRVPRDAVVIYCLHRGIGYQEAQEQLYDLDMTTLGEELRYERNGR